MWKSRLEMRTDLGTSWHARPEDGLHGGRAVQNEDAAELSLQRGALTEAVSDLHVIGGQEWVFSSGYLLAKSRRTGLNVSPAMCDCSQILSTHLSLVSLDSPSASDTDRRQLIST
jgi:hypothetical protein